MIRIWAGARFKGTSIALRQQVSVTCRWVPKAHQNWAVFLGACGDKLRFVEAIKEMNETFGSGDAYIDQTACPAFAFCVFKALQT